MQIVPTASSSKASSPTDGAALLDDVAEYLARFVAFPPHGLAAVALWAAHSHLADAGENTPRLALLSPEPGSGKTRTLELLEVLCPSPMLALNASAAPLFRTLQEQSVTLLFDEIDAIFGRKGKDDPAEDLRALLNAGHRKGASIPRCTGPTHSVVHFPVYCAVALAGLGDLPDTLMSRSVIIRMRRRAPHEQVEAFRRRLHAEDGQLLGQQLADWAASVAEEITGSWPSMPEGVADRPADVWEPLLAIADAAGGHWPDTAREACSALVAAARTSDSGSLGLRLLGDLQTVFGDADALPTSVILERLCAIEEAPWADLRGKPLDPRGLARRLADYDIGSRNVRQDGAVRKGYQREDFWDAWQRYFPDGAPSEGEKSATAATGATVQVKEPGSCSGRVAGSGNEKTAATNGEPVTSNVADVAHVADFPEETAPNGPETAHPDRNGHPPCPVCGEPYGFSCSTERRHPECRSTPEDDHPWALLADGYDD